MPPRLHMRDACQIGSRDAVTTGPEPTEAWTYGSAIRCRFARVSTREVVEGDVHEKTNVTITIPAGETVDDATRIKLTKRNRATLGTPEYFDVIGKPHYSQDNRCIVLDCVSVAKGAE